MWPAQSRSCMSRSSPGVPSPFADPSPQRCRPCFLSPCFTLLSSQRPYDAASVSVTGHDPGSVESKPFRKKDVRTFPLGLPSDSFRGERFSFRSPPQSLRASFFSAGGGGTGPRSHRTCSRSRPLPTRTLLSPAEFSLLLFAFLSDVF